MWLCGDWPLALVVLLLLCLLCLCLRLRFGFLLLGFLGLQLRKHLLLVGGPCWPRAECNLEELPINGALLWQLRSALFRSAALLLRHRVSSLLQDYPTTTRKKKR